MTSTVQVNVRMESEIKAEAEKVFAELGISASQAVKMFYRQVTLQQGLPFDVKIPNAETRAAMRDMEQSSGVQRYDSVQELFEDAGI